MSDGKKKSFKKILRYIKKLIYRYEEWRAGMGHLPVDLGSKR